MRKKLSIRLPDDLAKWLSETSRKTGRPLGQIVREELEKARKGTEKPFVRLLGSMDGLPGLSQRKGFRRNDGHHRHRLSGGQRRPVGSPS